MHTTLETTRIKDTAYRQAPDNHDLGHIPGEWGLPVIGRTVSVQNDVNGFLQEHVAKYGQPSRIGMGLQKGVLITHPDHLQQVLLDRDQCFSSNMGYEKTVSRYYGGSFLTQDFADHIVNRRIFQTSFKNSALKGYTEIMNDTVEESIADWARMKDFRYGQEVKKLLVDVGARVFFGVEGHDAETLDRMGKAFYKINEKGMMALLNVDLPGFNYHAGLKGKHEIEQIIIELIRERRKNPGKDLTSIIAQEVDENGDLWPEEVLVPHLSLLLFAAHDTTVGATSNLMMYLANPEFHHVQERLREKAMAMPSEHPSLDEINGYDEFEWAFYESLRLHPSASVTQRRTVRDVQIGEHLVPANTIVVMMVQWAHRSPEYWSNPEAFDIERFSPARKEHKSHSFCFVPFGGGAHKCIGMHFAMMNTKVILHHTLRKFRFEPGRGYRKESRVLPLPMPHKMLPLKVIPV